jgi:hypothetical protein
MSNQGSIFRRPQADSAIFSAASQKRSIWGQYCSPSARIFISEYLPHLTCLRVPQQDITASGVHQEKPAVCGKR